MFKLIKLNQTVSCNTECNIYCFYDHVGVLISRKINSEYSSKFLYLTGRLFQRNRL